MPSSTDKTSFRRTKVYDRAGCLIRHMIKILANSTIPVFAGLLLGYAAGLRNLVDNKDLTLAIVLILTARP
jgi:hypothetical protein